MIHLKRINTILLILIVLVNGYIILAPFLPALIFDWQSHEGDKQRLEQIVHAPQPKRSSFGSTKTAVSHGNSVIIPSMLLNTPILEGPTIQRYQVLNNGVWRWSLGSTPDKGGNTILIGHRFTYTNPRGIFYFLNKVSIGDDVGVFWNNKKYVYEVVSVQVVPPTDSAIQNQTTHPELTLFTCTPLWLPKDRLVVIADLEASP